MANTEKVRLNKYLSQAGICSRREADVLIEGGKVSVNGKIADPGMRVNDLDKITVEDKPVGHREKKVVLAYYKPVGVTCTEKDKHAQITIRDVVEYPVRVTYAGRLDRDSEGLLLLTNDGDLINGLMRAANFHEKEYLVRVNKPISRDFLKKMSDGMLLKDLNERTRPCFVKEEGKFVWCDGSAVTYTNWSQNEPNNSADCGGENYVQMYANGKWNDYTGQNVDVGFIGEFDKTPTATSTPAPTNTPNATQKPQATNRPQSTKKPQATKKPSSQNDDADYNWSSDDTSSDDVTVKKVTGVKVKKAAKKSLIVTWRWFVSQDGFEVQYALNKSFTKKKKTKRYDLYAERVKLRGLKRKKTYYVRVRAFKKVGTEKVYGKWSITKKCKVK